jgi:hypothetical protein
MEHYNDKTFAEAISPFAAMALLIIIGSVLAYFGV